MEFISALAPILAFIDESTLPSLNLVGRFVQLLYNWIGSYGWTVILFTVMLKLITLPLDFWQRLLAKRNSVKMSEMQPLLANIEKQYPNDPRKVNEEKQKIFKRYGYSVAGSCIPMIITMVVFIVMFSGLNSYTNYINKRDYAVLNATYSDSYEQAVNEGKSEYEAMEYAKQMVSKVYKEELEEKFLWIHNIWRPDTWQAPMADAKTFANGGFLTQGLTPEERATFRESKYNILYESVIKVNPGYFAKVNDNGTIKAGWNGLLILPVLAIGLSILSTYLTQKTTTVATPKSETDPTQQSNKMMMFMLPIMMGIFALFYTAAFSIYMVSNSLLTVLSTLLMQPIIDKKVAAEQNKAPKAGYKR